MFTYKIISIKDDGNKLTVLYNLFQDSKKIVENTLFLIGENLRSVAINQRSEYVSLQVLNDCYRYIIVQDVKSDFSSIIGVDTEIEPITYETKAEQEARIALEFG